MIRRAFASVLLVHLAAFVLAEDGFHLDGDRWTWREGGWEMTGILVKPEGPGPFPGLLVSRTPSDPGPSAGRKPRG